MKKEKNNTSKCPICGRPTHKDSKFCIFHAGAEEKTEEEFKNALKEYIQEIKEGDKDYNFKRFIFVEDINFKEDLNITVFKNAYFGETTFQGYANFEGATFQGKAYFFETTFKGYANFKKTSFKGKADFWEATFQGYAKFEGATFQGAVIFLDTIFKGNTYFVGATFQEDVLCWKTIFKGNAYFLGATFHEDSNFLETTFQGDADFRVKNFVKGLTLTKFRLLSGKKLNLKVRNNIETISLERAYLENTYLDIELVEGVLIDFTDASLKNTKIKKDQIENHILQEKKKKFYDAQEIYLLLKNNFHSIGQYEDERWACLKEKEMERKSYYSNVFTKNTENKEEKNEKKCQKDKKLKDILYSNCRKIKEFGKWIWSCFCNAIYGYGEKPWNVILSAGILIFVFAILFSFIGIANPEIIDLKGITVNLNNGNIVDSASKGLLKNNVIRNIPDSLYFSLITFTTLGYGDFRPLEGLGRILAGSEAFIGAFMMALFVYTFARRTGGR